MHFNLFPMCIFSPC